MERRDFVKGFGLMAMAAAYGCNVTGEDKEASGRKRDGGGNDDSESLILEYFLPCLPGEGLDEMEFELGVGNMPGIEEVISEDVTADTCGYVVNAFGNWVQRRVEYRINDLVGDADAVQRFAGKIGHRVIFDIFPKTESGEGSSLIRVNGLDVANRATKYEVYIGQSGLEQTAENEALPYWEQARGPLTRGEVSARMSYAGQTLDSALSRFMTFDIPSDARTAQVDLVELYGSKE